jgi:hypothetical protein
MVFAGWKGKVIVDGDGGVVQSFDATDELLTCLTSTKRFAPNGSEP